ncbi:MAG: right-handed parallel beta-helix repeat-containing protein [Xanthomonadaceae bacterium]|jgi:hypothetical protein|nr:right-handed parallel beta-helix repeat-containing protein [Xanthomonadaceae bacterium]
MSTPRYRCTCATALFVLGAVPFGPAYAATYCADDTAELVLALAAAAQSAEDDDVRVRSGTFSLTDDIFVVMNGALRLSGGWTAGCLLQSSSPGSSRITAATPGRYGIALRPRDGDLTVERLTFDRLDHIELRDFGTSSTVIGDINLLRNRFIDNDLGPIVSTKDKNVRVENNIVTGSLGRTFQFDRTAATAPFVADIHNNTFVGGTEGVRILGAPGAVRLRNNVMDGTYTSGGIVIVTGAVTVNHNAFDGGFTFSSGGSASPQFDNVVGIDPMFDASFVPQAGSSLVNSGTNSIVGGLPSVDFAGSPRRIGSRVDRGARESTISDVDTLTVTSSADSGPGTLRQAILDANVTAIEETIAFNLSGSCPRSISLATPLPTISSTVTIDGFTQPGSSPNALPDSAADGDDSVHCVVLASNGARALNLTPGPDQEITVRGLAFYRATEAQIRVSGSGRATIIGNAFNTGTSIFEPSVPQYAITVDGATGTRIGGNDPADRNIIGRASVAGVRLGPGTFRNVLRNFIGLSKSGTGDVGNGIGIEIDDGQNDSIDGNFIGHNDSFGVLVRGALSVASINRNFVGRAQGGMQGSAGNGNDGIRFNDGERFILRQNSVAYNAGAGISVSRDAAIADYGLNSTFANVALGIDVYPDGVNFNGTDTGTSGNRGQNYPVLASAAGSSAAGWVSGTLQSANGTYEITVYRSTSCDVSGHGEGRTFVGATTATISNGTSSEDGTTAFTANVTTSGNFEGQFLTAIAAERGGPDDGASSEYSACIAYQVVDLFSNGFEP